MAIETKIGAERSTRRRNLELSWVVGVVLFVIARFAVAYSALNDYGLTVWIFGFLDIVTAIPYAIGTARLVTSLVDRNLQSAARWGTVASASFLAPYLWVAWAGRNGEFPKPVYVVVVALVVCLGANAVIGVMRRVRTARVGHPAAMESIIGVP